MRGDARRDLSAEFALSAMVSMITILIFSAIVASITLMMIENVFMESRGQSVEQSKTLNAIPVILAFELETYDDTGNANDLLYLMFKFPYANSNIPDTNVKWAMLCDTNDNRDPPLANSAHTLVYSSGDFDAATPLSGTGDDDAAIDAFEPGIYYHFVFSVDDPGLSVLNECDIVEGMSATLVIAIENGRTTELDFEVPAGVRAGHDLMS